ncbi:hypothetical protein Pelo_14480 [Pelomyxa schiedti]|nr:hypothetical protein Pelo_14480 [Pelomyxa schiedti]
MMISDNGISDEHHTDDQLVAAFSRPDKVPLAPKICVVGRKGVGKTSIVRSLTGSDTITPTPSWIVEVPFGDASRAVSGYSADVVWYVLDASVNRMLPSEERICQQLGSHCAILLNKSDLCTQTELLTFITSLKRQLTSLNFMGIFTTVGKPRVQDIDKCTLCGRDDISLWRKKRKWRCELCGASGELKEMDQGFMDLLESTKQCLPQALQESFVSIQQVSFKLKAEYSKNLILEYWSELGQKKIAEESLLVTTDMLLRLCQIWTLSINSDPPTVHCVELPVTFTRCIVRQLVLCLREWSDECERLVALCILWALALHQLNITALCLAPSGQTPMVTACTDIVHNYLGGVSDLSTRVRDARASLPTLIDSTFSIVG